MTDAVPSYLRQPNWRWNIATAYIGIPGLSEQHVLGDLALMQAVQFYKKLQELRRCGGQISTLKHISPDIFDAYLIYNNGCNPAGFRWFLEAMLMTGDTPEEITKALNLGIRPGIISAFSSLFFDIKSYRDNRIAVMSNVLGTALRLSPGVGDYDFTWKSLAYEKGMTGFLDFVKFRTGGTLTPELRRWFREVTSDRFLYKAYQSSSDLRGEYMEQTIALFSAVQQNWKIEDAKEVPETLDSETTPKQFLAAMGMILSNPNLERVIAGNTDPVENQSGYDYSLLERIGLKPTVTIPTFTPALLTAE